MLPHTSFVGHQYEIVLARLVIEFALPQLVQVILCFGHIIPLLDMVPLAKSSFPIGQNRSIAPIELSGSLHKHIGGRVLCLFVTKGMREVTSFDRATFVQ
tara:strand:+ start:366 stop:665 length:300 start_codon:yes stop_codon:yes gene_type:complete